MLDECLQEKIRNRCIRIAPKMVPPTEAPIRRVDQMDDSPIIRGRERPRKTLRKTMKNNLDINCLSKYLVFDRT